MLRSSLIVLSCRNVFPESLFIQNITVLWKKTHPFHQVSISTRRRQAATLPLGLCYCKFPRAHTGMKGESPLISFRGHSCARGNCIVPSVSAASWSESGMCELICAGWSQVIEEELHGNFQYFPSRSGFAGNHIEFFVEYLCASWRWRCQADSLKFLKVSVFLGWSAFPRPNESNFNHPLRNRSELVSFAQILVIDKPIKFDILMKTCKSTAITRRNKSHLRIIYSWFFAQTFATLWHCP